MFKHIPGNKFIVLFLLLALLLPAASGCGSSSKETDSIGYVNYDQPEAPREEDGGLGAPPAIPNDVERKIIQTVDLTIQVDNVQSVMDKIIQLTDENKGYIVSSSIYKQEEYFRARLTVKIPREILNDTVSTISGFGEVTNNDTYTEDVTEEYYDSQARLKVMESKEARLIALLDKAADITDIIAIETELAQVRSDIEVLQGRLQYLTNSTSFSTINIELKQAIPGHVKAPQGTTGKAWKALINSTNNLIDFGSGLIVFLAAALPWLVILTVIYLIIRSIRKKRKDKKDA